jgi:dynein heavy chain 2
MMPNLCNKLNFSKSDEWRDWAISPDCEASLPKEKVRYYFILKYSDIQKLLIIQHLRPDRLLTTSMFFFTTVTSVCCRLLGIESIVPPTLSLKSLIESETTANEPIIFITTPGADPSQDLREFGSKQVGSDKYHEVSMGQGQGDHALYLVRDAAKSGHWVCLQNVHLAVAWLQSFQKEFTTLKFHPDFRLWVTTETHAKFPAILLENSLKITVEAPPGTNSLNI